MIRRSVQCILYYIYLVPAWNRFEINCPLPPDMHVTDARTGAPITHNTVLFTTTGLRTKIVWGMWVANWVVVVGALFLFSTTPKVKSMGMEMLRKLPSVSIGEELFQKHSDLTYLMELVYVNRHRLTFVK